MGAAGVSGLEAGFETGSDPGIGSGREFKVKASGFSGSPGKAKSPVKIRLLCALATYSRLSNLI